MDKYVIEIENLHKSYKDVEALKGISFSVLEGTLFSYIGLNPRQSIYYVRLLKVMKDL